MFVKNDLRAVTSTLALHLSGCVDGERKPYHKISHTPVPPWRRWPLAPKKPRPIPSGPPDKAWAKSVQHGQKGRTGLR